MANQRADDQVFIGLWVSKSLATKVDSVRKKEDAAEKSRSQWIRDAIADLLKDEGVLVSKVEKAGRDRVRKVYPPLMSNNNQMNDKPNLKTGGALTNVLKKASKPGSGSDSK
jgi:hypothetical protein